ncbi:MAG: radical SAM protein [Rhodospirillales bacterium]|nr:radical SAM protein [Rhodospirillales bacterium]
MARAGNIFGKARYRIANSSVLAPMIYGLLAAWRTVRAQRVVTRLLGFQYRRSRDIIEIDITYACNLQCLNCNRSSTQAPERSHLSVDDVRKFVNDSITSGKRWRRIRVLGGEPTLHPEFQAIIEVLRSYKRYNPGCLIVVVSNGFGLAVQAALERLPEDISIENTSKTSHEQPHFHPFNLAPADDPSFKNVDFRNGCHIASTCGMGLTPQGYYPCAVAGGIDRIVGSGSGRQTLPSDDDGMEDLLESFCRLCGHFYSGHHVQEALITPLNEVQMSPTWVKLYDDWHARRTPHRRKVPRKLRSGG